MAEVAGGAGVDVPASLGPAHRHGDDLIERWDGRVLRRALPYGDGAVGVAIEPLGDSRSPRLRVTAPDVAAGEARREAESLVSDAPDALEALCESDPVVARLVRELPPVRPIRGFDGFGLLVRAITAQQVNLRWAATTRARLAISFGEPLEVAGEEVRWLDPARLATVGPAELRELQLTWRKSEYIVGVAGEIAEGRLDLGELAQLTDERVIEILTALRGIGRWTAEWYLVRGLGRPRVVAGDLGVRKAVGGIYGLAEPPSEAEVRRLTDHWGGAAAVAQQLALAALANPLDGEE